MLDTSAFSAIFYIVARVAAHTESAGVVEQHFGLSVEFWCLVCIGRGLLILCGSFPTPSQAWCLVFPATVCKIDRTTWHHFPFDFLFAQSECPLAKQRFVFSQDAATRTVLLSICETGKFVSCHSYVFVFENITSAHALVYKASHRE